MSCSSYPHVNLRYILDKIMCIYHVYLRKNGGLFRFIKFNWRCLVVAQQSNHSARYIFIRVFTIVQISHGYYKIKKNPPRKFKLLISGAVFSIGIPFSQYSQLSWIIWNNTDILVRVHLQQTKKIWTGYHNNLIIAWCTYRATVDFPFTAYELLYSN